MPVFNTNDRAQQDHVGADIRDVAYRLIDDQPKTDMVANAKVDQQLQAYGLQNQQVVLDKALEAGRAMDADYVLLGSASKQDRRIQFELSIADVRLSSLVKTEKGDAARPEDLTEKVGTVIRVLLAAVEKP
jgi:hypothetical protein